MKKKKPVTSHGYFPRIPDFVSLRERKRVRSPRVGRVNTEWAGNGPHSYPADSPPSAAAALTGFRISLFSGELSRRRIGRSWRPEIKFPPSPIAPIGLAKAVNDDDDDAVLNWRWIATIGRLSCGIPATGAVVRNSTRDSISKFFSQFFSDSERGKEAKYEVVAYFKSW